MYYLLKYCDNYSDEFDIDGATVITEKQLNSLLDQIELIRLLYDVKESYFYAAITNQNKQEAYKDFLREVEYQISFELVEEIASLIDVNKLKYEEEFLFGVYFGTNEEIIYYYIDDIKKSFSYEEISEEEYECLKKYKLDNIGYASLFIDSIRLYLYKDWIWDETVSKNDEQAVIEYNTKINNIMLKMKQELGE